jgi:hypothetical protein
MRQYIMAEVNTSSSEKQKQKGEEIRVPQIPL